MDIVEHQASASLGVGQLFELSLGGVVHEGDEDDGEVVGSQQNIEDSSLQDHEYLQYRVDGTSIMSCRP